jgi:hypothetical protein
MKKLNIASLLSLVITLFIGACSSDSEAPKEQFNGIGETVSLKTAHLYLVGESDYSNGNGDFIYRDYFLTDGTFSSGDGWDLEDYTNATYYVAVQVIIPADDAFEAGSYASTNSFSTLGAADKGVYFYVEGEDGNYYESTSGESTANFTISGGLNDEETMTVKFSGGLSHWILDGNWVETEFTGKIFVKAQVEDVRPL